MTRSKHILEEHQAVVFTGAGMSEESGIPTFRTGSALWEKYDPIECCSVEALETNPIRVWDLVEDMSCEIHKNSPNEGHKILAKMEKMGLISHIITQNVDGYHQRAGSKNVIELHGNINSTFCTHCNKAPSKTLDIYPPKCFHCGNQLRPGITLFGDSLGPAFDEALEVARNCKTMIVIGTSGLVQPASLIPWEAIMNGANLIEINPKPAGFASPNHTITMKAIDGLKLLMAKEKR